MENSNKVFVSEIIRTGHRHRNNLYDLLKRNSAKPLEFNEVNKHICEFVPRTDKIYIPKRRLKAKVKTVRDIRTTFENDVYVYLKGDLEAQQNYLLQKIRAGSSRNENTQNIAKKIFISETPIPRSTWQMLVNLNPDHNIHPQQFVLWNGKYIQVNGSKGGKSRLICNYDLANTKIPLLVKNKTISNIKYVKKKSLLRNSLAVKFKPGPLRRKKILDDSHQNYHGDIELVNLPKVGLVVEPTYGTAMEPTITKFLNNLLKEDGIISEKWAEFAVSVLGKNDKSNAKLLNGECVTFDIKYKCNQHRILMRKDWENSVTIPSVAKTTIIDTSISKAQFNVLPVIKDMMNKILDAVEININQDTMFSVDEDFTQIVVDEPNPVDLVTLSKDKTKKKYFELEKLDVTVIRIPENIENGSTQSCGNVHCSLGCICDSVRNTYHVRQHCRREECMFICNCEFSKNSNTNSLSINSSDSTHLIYGLTNIKNKINTTLAKEEQKFHQTVIVAGEKNILLRNEKRNWKSSKKYESFYKNICLKNVDDVNRVLSIPTLRLDCDNIEPWCMIHNLYKCFCKGKFTASSASNILKNVTKETISKDTGPSYKIQKHSNPDVPLKSSSRQRCDAVNLDQITKKDNIPVKTRVKTCEKPKTLTVSDILKKHQRNSRFRSNADSETDVHKHNEGEPVSYDSNASDYFQPEHDGMCSRVNGYAGRKYSARQYTVINNKIKGMEKNDKVLQRKIMNIVNIDVEKENDLLTERKQKPLENESEMNSPAENIIQTKAVVKDKIVTNGPSPNHNFIRFLCNINGVRFDEDDKLKSKGLSTENSAVEWLESNYKLYKKRIDQGLVKSSLEPPKVGKIALHSWDFILSRYRERKNLFLISKHKPYRIFMGIHTRNPFFESCININEIRFADLHKYPQTVKNLLTNARDLKDNFCILRGLEHCWELAGSVAKVRRNEQNTDDITDETSDISSTLPSNFGDEPNEEESTLDSEQTNEQNMCFEEDDTISDCHTKTESSKWFIMTVENDFTEIRFYKKGFFVKYESIIKAINVARISGKTVRLSSQKCVDKCNSPQFGIYAIPNGSEHCVFIGPYEMDDSLGIETIKLITDVTKVKRTRGFWMNTNKIDNLRVIDNPLSFMPLSDLKKNESVPLDDHFSEDTKTIIENEPNEIIYLKKFDETQQKALFKLDSKKIIKPIKIRKMNNGLYHLTKGSLLKPVPLQSPPKIVIKPTLAITTGVTLNETNISSDTLPYDSTLITKNSIISTPTDLNVNEGPQIKISAVFSQRDEQNLKQNKSERGMFILKPKEINRKLLKDQLNSETSTSEVLISENVVENSSPEKIEYPLLEDQDIETSACVISCASVTPWASVTPCSNVTPCASVTTYASVTPCVSITRCASATPCASNTPCAGVVPCASVTRCAGVTSCASVTPCASGTPCGTVTPSASDTPFASVTPCASGTPSASDTSCASGTSCASDTSCASAASCASADDVFIISDDECDSNSEQEQNQPDRFKQVLIICTDVNDLGWIWGRQHCSLNRSLLSYKLPGSEYSDFYTENYAFRNLNKDLSQIIRPSTPFEFNWRVIDSLDDIKTEVTQLDSKRLKEIFKLRAQTSERNRTITFTSNNVRTYSKITTSRSAVGELITMTEPVEQTTADHTEEAVDMDEKDCQIQTT